MTNAVRPRLGLLGKTQVELLAKVKKRGFTNLTPQQFSTYVNGHSNTPQAKAVMAVAYEVIDEWEKQVDDLFAAESNKSV